MHDMIDRLMGFDNKNETINLWYEVSYVRLLLTNILDKCPEIGKFLTEEMINKTRLEAQDIVKNRFPLMKVQFLTPEEAEEQKKKSEESLKEMLKKDSRSCSEFTALMSTSDQKEDPSCTH